MTQHIRVIPCLLLYNQSLVKTVKFKNPNYIGDPINTVRIFNQMEVDELIFLDINATTLNKQPDFNFIEKITGECFMPICYGGGIQDLQTMEKIYKIGVEKIAINTYAIENPYFIKQASEAFGSQSIIISIDVKKNLFGKYEIYYRGKNKIKKIDLLEYVLQTENLGAGEILLTSVDRDGTWSGYDLTLIKAVTERISIPLICCGGAANLTDFHDAVLLAGASAVAAGSMFVYQGKDLGVLINYPSAAELDRLFVRK
ncbi:MAG: AglZ/HisF2 family acetamidino modification protein [Ignavibacteria bacterium]